MRHRLHRPDSPPAAAPIPSDLSDTVTAFLITVGESTTNSALDALANQTSKPRVEVISNVAPMNVAFQSMLDRAANRFHLQVDADMILYPNTVARLYETIMNLPERVAFVCAPLWDEFERRPLYGVKIYRSDVMRRYPYRASYSCETDQMHRLREDGYTFHLIPLANREECAGLHGTNYTPPQVFRRWKRLVVKQRRSAVGKTDPMDGLPWIEPYYRRHAQWYREESDPALLPVRMAALLGMVAGLLEHPLPQEEEDDFRVTDPQWLVLNEKFGILNPDELPEVPTQW